MHEVLGHVAGYSGPSNGRSKGFKTWKTRKETLGVEGSCKRTISAGGHSAWEENNERNSFLLPRLWCSTRVRLVAKPVLGVRGSGGCQSSPGRARVFRWSYRWQALARGC